MKSEYGSRINKMSNADLLELQKRLGDFLKFINSEYEATKKMEEKKS